MNTSQIDSIILSEVGEHWTKVAMVICRVADAMSPTLSTGDEGYEVISRRIEALVNDGRLVAQGDTKKLALQRSSPDKLNSWANPLRETSFTITTE